MDVYLEACSYLAMHGCSVYGDEGEDQEDDQVFTQDPLPYGLVQSDRSHGDRSSEDSGTLSPIGPLTPLEEDPEKQLQRRRMVLSKVLENEGIYVSELESLLMPIRPLKAVAYTSQPVLTSQEIQTIFFNVPELHNLHKDFCSKLKERTEGGDALQPVGDLFQQL
uniref:breakpoint cluster region protein-like n=1 Tax=Pristiophorus japonicus TaxID=55135 RepID=UPI00398E5BE1